MVVGGGNPACVRVERRGYQTQGLLGSVCSAGQVTSLWNRKTRPRNSFSVEQEISCVPPSVPPSRLRISISISSLRENKHCNLICVPSKSNVSFRLLKCKRWACFHIHWFIQATKVYGGPTRARILLGTTGGAKMNKTRSLSPRSLGSAVETNALTSPLQ